MNSSAFIRPLLLAGGLALLVPVGIAQETAPAPEENVPGPKAPTSAPIVRSTAGDPLGFENLDADGDGRLVLSEFTAPAAKQRKAESVDKNPRATAGGDSAVAGGVNIPAETLESRYSPEVFKILDVNHDDALSPAELEALRTNAHNISQP
jgi:hypothetical protein